MKHITLLLMALTVGVSAAWAQAKPDFTGSWKLLLVCPGVKVRSPLVSL